MKKRKIKGSLVALIILAALLACIGAYYYRGTLFSSKISEKVTHLFSRSDKNTNQVTSSIQPETITSMEQLKAIVNSDMPAVIKFYSDWCPACNSALLIYPTIAEQFKDTVKFYSVNVNSDINEQAETQLAKGRIQAIPTFVFYQKEKVHEQVEGFSGLDGLRAEVMKHFNLT